MSETELRKGYFAVLGAVVIWAGWMVSTRFLAAGALTPYDISALRFAVAGSFLLPVAWNRGLALGPYGWRGSLLLTLFLGPPYIIVVATGMQFAPASHAAAIVNSCMVLTSLFLGVYWLKEPFSARRRAGVGILILGMACVIWAKLGGTANFGHLLFAMGGAMWAGYGVCLRRWQISSWHATAAVSVLSALLYLPIYALFLPKHIASATVDLLLFHGLYQGLLTSVLALYLYGRAVLTLGASTTSAFVPLVPILTLLLAIPVLGEIPTPLEIAGVALVFVGLLVVLWSPERWKRPRAATSFPA